METAQNYITKALRSTCVEVATLTKIPVAINPDKLWTEVQAGTQMAYEERSAVENAELGGDKNRITALTREVTTILVGGVEGYKNGTEPAITDIDPSSVNVGPAEVANHVHKQSQRAKSVLASMPGLRAQMWVALVAAIFLAMIAALGVSHPLMVKAMGENGDPASLGTLVWMVIGANAIALTLGAVNTLFFRAPVTRLSPWATALVGAAIFFIAARYVASAMNAEFLLMQDLPPWAQLTVRIIETVGIGVALICVELGAGRSLAFAWFRFQQVRTDPPRLLQLLEEITEWESLRAKVDAASHAVRPVSGLENLRTFGVMLITQAVDGSLAQHRETLRKYDAAIEQPWAGSALEHVDIEWLRGQVTACETARDELLKLAGMQPPPDAIAAAATAPSTPPSSPTAATV